MKSIAGDGQNLPPLGDNDSCVCVCVCVPARGQNLLPLGDDDSCVCVCVCERARARMRARSITQSCWTLCNPMDGSPLDSSVHRISQARVLEWVAIFFSREYSRPGN